MKKIKLLPSIIMLALCLAVLGIGVYSATTGSNTISGTLTVNSAGYEVELTVYKFDSAGSSIGANMTGTRICETTTSRAGANITISDLEFNSDDANTIDDVGMIDIIIAVTNKASVPVGVYFWNGTAISNNQAGISNILYGHQNLDGDDGEHDDIVDAEYSFYHCIPAKSGNMTYTEYMHIYLNLNYFTASDVDVDLDINLNVEEYVANFTTSDLDENNCAYSYSTAFVKMACQGMTGAVTEFYFGSNDSEFNSYISYVVVPYGVTTLSDGNFVDWYIPCPFQQSEALRVVSLPITLTSIYSPIYGTFDNYMESVMVPSSVTSMGRGVFYTNSGLTLFTHNNVKYLPFMGSKFGIMVGFTSNSMTSLVVSKGARLFCANMSALASLTSITVERGNTIYDTRNNCNALIKTATNTLERGCASSIIPNTVTSIGDSAFAGCTGLTSITIPNSVTSIGTDAFNGCSNLGAITIPSGVTEIKKGTFGGCTSLGSVYIPDGMLTIRELAFANCSSLTSIFLPSSITTIEVAFSDESGSDYWFNFPFYDCVSLSIRCGASSRPAGWSDHWNCYDDMEDYCSVTWNQTR